MSELIVVDQYMVCLHDFANHTCRNGLCSVSIFNITNLMHSKDIPINFIRVTLLKNAPNPLGVVGSKGIGIESDLLVSDNACYIHVHCH